MTASVPVVRLIEGGRLAVRIGDDEWRVVEPEGDDTYVVGPPSGDHLVPVMPIVADLERCYVEAINAVLSAPPSASADVERWRGHAEAYRTIAERLRSENGLLTVDYRSVVWRQANGIGQ